ncbi:hypothetical protein [Corynebacterium neomassiliense]|uniref:hypothetical protein n=1 Tax=Corynebacterium neomassiliense TaxID=2079482 RepID=UPI001F3EE288|nr:hypothetical protein [Corynebacterium neomassiliense]
MSLTWNGDAIAAAVKQAEQRGVRLAAEHLRTTAVQQTPLETGALRNSAQVTVEGTRAAVSFNTKYAVKQHEELGYSHKDGRAKYLESATVSEKDTMAQIIGQQIKGAL